MTSSLSLPQNQLPFGQIVENTRSAVRSQAIESACRFLTHIPVITQQLAALPQVQELGAKITEFAQNIPYLEPFTQNFVGSVASIAPEGARSCALILSSMSGASAATARILYAGHNAMRIARKLYQNLRNASGKWNQVKQLAALGLLGAGVEAIHHVFKTDTLKTAQTLALLTMFPRTTEAWMFANAAVCGGVVGGTLGALRKYYKTHGRFPVAHDFLTRK
jgi:hypothetical protein